MEDLKDFTEDDNDMTYEEQLEAWAKKNQDQKEEWDKAHDRDCKVHDEWMRNEIAIASMKAVIMLLVQWSGIGTPSLASHRGGRQCNVNGWSAISAGA